MKIAYDSQIFLMQEYGGISRYICSLASLLSHHQGIETKIFAPMHINAYLSSLPEKLVCGHKIPRIPKTGRLISIVNQIPLRIAINRFCPDIVHETFCNASSSAPKSARTVVTVHDMIHERFPSEFSKQDRTSECKRIATQRADHVICVSENTRKDLLEFFDLPEDKVSVVYHGIDNLVQGLFESVCKNKPYLLYVGQRGSYKNFEGLLRAYASSPWLRNNFDLRCFGGGVFSRDEKKLFDDLKLSDNQLIHMTGNDDKLASTYRDAALFVYPSLYEGFGIPPLEAMSLGCPVACSNNSSIPEIVGDAAEYFDPKSIESIRIAIEKILNSTIRQAKLIDLGRLRFSQFSKDRCAEETLAVYKNLM